MTGWWWIGFGTLTITAWAVAASNAGSALLPLDQWVLEGLARLRTPALTRVMQAVTELGSRGVIIVLGWATILVIMAFRRFRRLFVFLGSFFYFAHWLTQLVKEHREQSAAILAALERLAVQNGDAGSE